MQDLITHGDAPTGATVPNQLSSKRLWRLDIDDDLWVDLAQDGQYQEDAPRWLFDEPTKKGIWAMLDLLSNVSVLLWVDRRELECLAVCLPRRLASASFEVRSYYLFYL